MPETYPRMKMMTKFLTEPIKTIVDICCFLLILVSFTYSSHLLHSISFHHHLNIIHTLPHAICSISNLQNITHRPHIPDAIWVSFQSYADAPRLYDKRCSIPLLMTKCWVADWLTDPASNWWTAAAMGAAVVVSAVIVSIKFHWNFPTNG